MAVRWRPRAQRQPIRYQGHRRRSGARHARAGGGRDISRQGRVSGMVAIDAASALRHPEEGVGRNPRAQGRAGPAAVARGRQDAAGRHRRSRARRPDICVLCRRMPADGGRETRLGAPRHRHRDHARGAGRCRPDHAVEFPDRDPGLEDRAGAGLWQHRGDQARGPRPGLDLGAGRYPAPRRFAQGRAQPRDRARLRSRRGPVGASRRSRHQFHRVGGHRPEGRRGLHRLAADEEVSARDGRQESAGRSGRRGSEDRGGMRRQQRVLFHRTALHGRFAADRHIRHPRQVRRGPDRADARPEDRRRRQGRHRYRPGGAIRASSIRISNISPSARRRVPSWRSAASVSTAMRPASICSRRCSPT